MKIRTSPFKKNILGLECRKNLVNSTDNMQKLIQQQNYNSSEETTQKTARQQQQYNCTTKTQQSSFTTKESKEYYSSSTNKNSAFSAINEEIKNKYSDNKKDHEISTDVNEYNVKANIVLRNKSFEIKNDENRNSGDQTDEDFNDMEDEFVSLGLAKGAKVKSVEKSRESTFVDDSSASKDKVDLNPSPQNLIPQRNFLTQCLSELESCIISNKKFGSSKSDFSSTTDFTSSSFDSETLTVEDHELTTETETETKTSEYDHFVFGEVVQNNIAGNSEVANKIETDHEMENSDDKSVHNSTAEKNLFFLTECSSSDREKKYKTLEL